LEELFKTDEVSGLMAKFIVPWNFVLLQDCCFWNFKNYVSFQLSLLYKNLLNLEWFQVTCSNWRHTDTRIILFSHLPIWNFQQIKQCCIEILSTMCTLGISEKFQHLIMLLICHESDHTVG
jgi:hypothetical protein